MKACIWHKGDDLYYMPNSYRRRSSGLISSRRRREGQIYMMYYEIGQLERELMGAYPILLSQLRSCFDDKFMICRSPIFRNLLDEGEAKFGPSYVWQLHALFLFAKYWSSHRFCSPAKWLIQHRFFSYGDPHLCIGSHHTYISIETRR